jgi:hypothetical protein
MTSVNVSAVSNTVVVTENGSSTVVTVPVTSTVTAITEGPQGPSGVTTGALPVGGNAGNILIKQTSANYDTDWAATLDGGTFN